MENQTLEQPIARGRTADVYAWGEGQVLKLFNDWVSPDTVQREIEVNQIVTTKTLPTPKFIGTTTVQGRTGLIFERVDGTSMLEMMGQKPWRIPALARQLAEVQTAIHQQDGGGLPQVRLRLGWGVSKADVRPDLKAAVLNVLKSLPDGQALCHSDFHPDQIMMASSGPVVIDWVDACQGDPLADVARTVILVTVGEPMDASPAMLMLTRTARGIFYRAYMRRYLTLNPAASMERVRAWMIPIATARLNENIPGEPARLVAMVRKLLQNISA